MRLSDDVKHYIDQSILCWLATASINGEPNVSPKEAFCAYGDTAILIANIASPQSARNIRANPKVCLSFIDVLVQKGYQVHGYATCIGEDDPVYDELKRPLQALLCGKFPFKTIFKIDINRTKQILAPSYFMFPNETTEEGQIEAARKQYGF